MRSLVRLAATEMKLFVREPIVLTFVFAFPVLTVLVIGGVFDDDDPNFEGALPSDYYVAAYIAVVIAAIGLVMLPVHLASYRERDLLRRFDVSRYPRWALPAAWILVAMAITIVAVAVLLVTAQLVYGLPQPDHLLGVVAGTLLGAFTFTASASRWAGPTQRRSAQGLGCCSSSVLPPRRRRPTPRCHGRPDQSISTALPLTHVVRSVQEPWLDLGSPTGHLAVLAALAVVATAGWVTLATVPHRDRPRPGRWKEWDDTFERRRSVATSPRRGAAMGPSQADPVHDARRRRRTDAMRLFIDLADDSSGFWFYWPMLGTGIGVAITAVVLLGVGGVFGVDWEQREIDRYMAHGAGHRPGPPVRDGDVADMPLDG